MRLRYALMLCVLATPAAAQPDTNSGNYMLPYCQEKPPSGISGRCAGIIETVAYLGSYLVDGARFCPPRTATNGQNSSRSSRRDEHG